MGGEAAPMVRLFLLGGFRVRRDGQQVLESAFSRRQAQTLVKLLALAPSHQLHREQLIDLLWPETVFEDDARNLRKLLYYARRALDAGDRYTVLPASQATIGLRTESVWIDVDDFESAAHQALVSREISGLTSAVARYGGELLPEDRYEPWAERRREELATLHLKVLGALAQALEEAGRDEDAIDRLQQLLAIEPADENAHRALMRLFVRGGNERKARRQYQLCREALAEHLAAEPSAETETFYRQIVEGGQAPPRLGLPAGVPRGGVALVGRDRALQLITLHWPRGPVGNAVPSTERRPVTLIDGDAGVGKTRLAAEAARVAARHGALVLWGSTSTLGGNVAYGPFVEALEEAILHIPPEERERIAGEHPELGRLLPSLAVREPGGGDPQSEHARLFAGVARVLTLLAGDRMLLLVIDDLQGADIATFQLLRYLARLAGERRWFILGTSRKGRLDEQEAELRTLSVELQRTGAGRHIDLLPLGRRECDRLVASILAPEPVSHDVLEHIFTLSLGNPLFVTTLIETLRESGTLMGGERGWELAGDANTASLPRGVTALIESIVQSLGPELHASLALAAVCGMTCDPGLLAGATGQEEDAVLIDLDRAVEVGILEERGLEYAFRHPLFRETLYQRLSGHRRTRLHGALGGAIERTRPSDIVALAYHFGRSADNDRAIRYLEQAADRSRDAFANQLAESQYRALIDRLAPLDRHADLAAVEEKLGALLMVMARLPDALTMLESSVALYRRVGDTTRLARAAARIGDIHSQDRTYEEGLRYVASVLRDFEGEFSGAALSWLHLARAVLFFNSGQFEAALDAGNRAVEAIGSPEDSPGRLLLARVRMNRGIALINLRQIETGRVELVAALAICRERNDLSEFVGLIEYNLGWVAALQGKLQDHVEHAQACVDVMRRIGAPVRIAMAVGRLGLAHFMAGDWEQARTLVDQAIAEDRSLRASLFSTHIVSHRGILALATGDLVAARRLLQEAFDGAVQVNDVVAHSISACYLAEVDLEEGRPREALERLQPLLTTVRALPREHLEAVRIYARAAWLFAELGQIEEAERVSAMAVDPARSGDVPILRADALTYRGLVLAAQQRWEESERYLTEALTLIRTIGYAWREAWTLACWAEVERRRGRIGRARELASRSADIYRRHGGEQSATRVLACIEAGEEQEKPVVVRAGVDR